MWDPFSVENAAMRGCHWEQGTSVQHLRSQVVIAGEGRKQALPSYSLEGPWTNLSFISSADFFFFHAMLIEPICTIP